MDFHVRSVIHLSFFASLLLSSVPGDVDAITYISRSYKNVIRLFCKLLYLARRISKYNLYNRFVLGLTVCFLLAVMNSPIWRCFNSA